MTDCSLLYQLQKIFLVNIEMNTFHTFFTDRRCSHVN